MWAGRGSDRPAHIHPTTNMKEGDDMVQVPETARLYTRRDYLTIKVTMTGESNVWAAIEAVSSTAIEHPEWDMDERRTWDEWEATS